MNSLQPPESSPQSQTIDKSPWGHRSSKLLGVLSLSLPLPRVHAAETPTAPPPQYVGRPELPDTGWDRIKDLFIRDEMQRYPEELTNVVKSGLMAAVVGMLYGGLPAARHARERFIEQSQAEVYQHRVEAVRSAHNAAIRGFVRFGWRWSWRVAAFVTLFNTVSTGVSVYRDRYALSHYVTAGAITGGIFRLNLGLGGLVAGSAIGAVLGLPAGALMMGVQKLSGETIHERRRRERREQYELKMAEWTARLQVTEELIGEIGGSGREQEAESDLQKINELLSLPRNEGVTRDSDSQ